MTESEALKYFKDANRKNMVVGILPKSDIGKCVMQALEKQIQKKTENKKYSFYPHSTLLKSKYGECPVCKSMQVDDEYCANCGQKLDWSDEE